MAEISWKDACIKVLKSADSPMHYSEIAGEILSKKYKTGTTTANPSANVYTNIYSSIKKEGDKSPFVQSGKGLFSLKPSLQPTNTKKQDKSEEEHCFIKAAGVFWKRELVDWKISPKLIGKQFADSNVVDLSNQRGIYILYDNHTPVYVGRVTDQPLGKRISEHTRDKHSDRWTRFSWFGILEVDDNGELSEPNKNIYNRENFISTLEAVLIETLEPPRNMRRGDGFSGYEYLQAEDESLKQKTMEEIIRKMFSSMHGSAV